MYHAAKQQQRLGQVLLVWRATTQLLQERRQQQVLADRTYDTHLAAAAVQAWRAAVQSRVAARVAADTADQHYQRRQLACCWAAWSGQLDVRMGRPHCKQPSQVCLPRAAGRAAVPDASIRAGTKRTGRGSAAAAAAAGASAQRSRRAGPDTGPRSNVWGALLKNSRKGPHQARAAAAQGWKQLQQEHAKLDSPLLVDVTNSKALGSRSRRAVDQCPRGSRRRRGTAGAGGTHVQAGGGAHGRTGQSASWLGLLQCSHAPAVGGEEREGHRVPADVAHTACRG
jgi:hypothetical protein